MRMNPMRMNPTIASWMKTMDDSRIIQRMFSCNDGVRSIVVTDCHGNRVELYNGDCVKMKYSDYRILPRNYRACLICPNKPGLVKIRESGCMDDRMINPNMENK